MARCFEGKTLMEHLTKMLLETAINNTGYKTYASNVYRDIAVNRLSVWLEFAPAADVIPIEFHERCIDLEIKKRANMVEVVRCKDCVHGTKDFDKFLCEWNQEFHDGDWFCADGERREE